MPTLANLRQIQKIKDPVVRKAWLKAAEKEFSPLIKSGTFSIEDPLQGEAVLPTLEKNRVKLRSDGTLDKLKVRIVVRGALQKNESNEDKWSPTAPF